MSVGSEAGGFLTQVEQRILIHPPVFIKTKFPLILERWFLPGLGCEVKIIHNSTATYRKLPMQAHMSKPVSRDTNHLACGCKGDGA